LAGIKPFLARMVAVTAVVMLGLGIGATTAISSFVDAVLFKHLLFQRPMENAPAGVYAFGN